MEGMFNGAYIFNSDISNWDVSNVTNMNSLFNIALAFNGDISAWDVSNVITMNLMFSNAQAFNQEIGNWDVCNVNDMRYIFSAASNFNQYIGNWDVSNVTYMGGMFYYSSGFDQDLSNWNVSNVVDMSEMFDYTSLSRINYDLLLNGWSNLTLQNGVNFSAGSSQYCEGLTARARIISNFGWNITDGGQEDGCIMGDYFITTWQTTTPNESITIPTTGSGYDYSIDWGDGTVQMNQTGNATHTYTDAGVYTVKILGDFPRIYFKNSGGRLKIKSIEQWGSNAWSSMEKAFDGCRYLVSNATDVPNLSGVTSTELMFRNCLGFNGDLSGWDVSSVTTMNGMFFANTTFNEDLSSWDVSNVTDMSYMFSGAIAFNQDISSWDVSNVTTMTNMFEFAYAFNQDIGGWNVVNVTTMDYMFKYAEEFNQNIGAWNVGNVTSMVSVFYGAASFNQDIGNWNVANVTIMDYMFASASVFNQDIGAWNVGNVATTVHMFENALVFNQDISSWDVSYIYDMSYMFSNAIAFDQNLGGWNVENVIDMQEMFFNNTLSTANYDALLNGWSSQALQYNVVFNGGNSTYCAGEDARNLLLDTFGWNVLDAGRNCEDICETTTIYSASGWSNGFPDTTMIAVFNSDYNTTLGSLDACSIQIKPGVTVTVSEGTTIKAAHEINIEGDLIFLSSATGNGELAAMGSTSTIIGEATVQRYMKNKRSYRMVSPAVTTTSSIHDNWQEGANSNTHNPNPGFGTHITGSTTDQMNGFDGTSTGNHSMFTVNVASQQFQVVANTDVNTLTAGNPYLLFVRGDRSIDLNDNNAAGETVLRATGALLTGTQIQNFATEDAGDFAMFGNPYQSAVDINSVLASSTNVKTGYYYVYDPSLGDNGAYVTVNLPAGTNTSSSAANQYLQPGQGGQFATLAAGTSSIVFNEGDKTPGEFTSTNRPLAGNDMLAVQLYTTENFNNGGPVHDSFGILFAEGNDNGLTPADAVKPFNFYENLGIDHEGTYLSLERREMPQEGEVYSLYSGGYSQTEYTLKIIVDGLEDSILYLDDNFTGTSTLLEIGETAYAFNVNASEPLSKATDRFSIRTEQRLGVADGNLLSGIRLYPNPLNADTFYINAPRLNGEEVMVSINDMSGRIIYDQILDCHSNTVAVPMDEKISSGVYLVSLKHGGDSNTFRLIIE